MHTPSRRKLQAETDSTFTTGCLGIHHKLNPYTHCGSCTVTTLQVPLHACLIGVGSKHHTKQLTSHHTPLIHVIMVLFLYGQDITKQTVVSLLGTVLLCVTSVGLQ